MKGKSDPIILSKFIVLIDDRRQTDSGAKTVFSHLGVLKRGDLMKIGKVILHVKPLPSHTMRI